MKETLEYLLNKILGENVATVEESDTDGYIVLTVFAPQDQIGKVIGKGGKTVNSLKNILKIQAIKEGKKVDIQIKEPQA